MIDWLYCTVFLQPLEIHETVAECMIFANHWVAKKIAETFPSSALVRPFLFSTPSSPPFSLIFLVNYSPQLRHHPLPRKQHFTNLTHCAASKGFSIDTRYYDHEWGVRTFVRASGGGGGGEGEERVDAVVRSSILRRLEYGALSHIWMDPALEISLYGAGEPFCHSMLLLCIQDDLSCGSKHWVAGGGASHSDDRSADLVATSWRLLPLGVHFIPPQKTSFQFVVPTLCLCSFINCNISLYKGLWPKKRSVLGWKKEKKLRTVRCFCRSSKPDQQKNWERLKFW